MFFLSVSAHVGWFRGAGITVIMPLNLGERNGNVAYEIFNP